LDAKPIATPLVGALQYPPSLVRISHMLLTLSANSCRLPPLSFPSCQANIALCQGHLVSWSAKKQPIVAHSGCESEYQAMANAAAELMWFTHLMRNLHVYSTPRTHL